MIIRRMQVEGGFLDGLDLRFEHGLNVLIGGRGTGKSSVIELIRYCLDVRGASDEQDAKRSREQALSVLQDGQVTLSIEDYGSDLVVSRSANADPEGLEPGLTRPLIYSQSDVESVGLSIRGRLNIVDFFSADPERFEACGLRAALKQSLYATVATGFIGQWRGHSAHHHRSWPASPFSFSLLPRISKK